MKQIFKRVGALLVLIVMAAMALCGCKKKVDERLADVREEDFEKSGYLLGTLSYKNPNFVTGYSSYFYTVKNNSEVAVAIVGTATAYGNDGKALAERNDDIAVLGPGETSLLMFDYESHEDLIDHVDCKLKYYKTDLLPVIRDIQTEIINVDDSYTVIAKNNSAVDVEYLNGIMLFFDSDNNVVSMDIDDFYMGYSGEHRTLKPGTRGSMLLCPANYYSVVWDHYDHDEGIVEYDHVELYLSYLHALNYSNEKSVYVQKKSERLEAVPTEMIEEKYFQYTDINGSPICCVIVKNISDKMMGIIGEMTVCDIANNTLLMRPCDTKGIAPGESAVLKFNYLSLDGDHYPTKSMKNTCYYAYDLLCDPNPEQKSHASDFDLDPRINEEPSDTFMRVYATYNGDEEIWKPSLLGVFYDPSGEVSFIAEGWYDASSLDNKGVDPENQYAVKKGSTIVFRIDFSNIYPMGQETDELVKLPEYDRYELYLID